MRNPPPPPPYRPYYPPESHATRSTTNTIHELHSHLKQASPNHPPPSKHLSNQPAGGYPSNTTTTTSSAERRRLRSQWSRTSGARNSGGSNASNSSTFTTSSAPPVVTPQPQSNAPTSAPVEDKKQAEKRVKPASGALPVWLQQFKNEVVDFADFYIGHLFQCETSPPSVTANHPMGHLPPLQTFITHILARTRISLTTLLSALFFLKRLKSIHSTCKGTYGSGHRLVLAAVIVASKYIYDDTYDNKAWATVSQELFRPEEVNQMEMELLHFLDYRLFVSKQTWAEFMDEVQQLMNNHVQLKSLPGQLGPRTLMHDLARADYEDDGLASEQGSLSSHAKSNVAAQLAAEKQQMKAMGNTSKAFGEPFPMSAAYDGEPDTLPSSSPYIYHVRQDAELSSDVLAWREDHILASSSSSIDLPRPSFAQPAPPPKPYLQQQHTRHILSTQTSTSSLAAALEELSHGSNQSSSNLPSLQSSHQSSTQKLLQHNMDQNSRSSSVATLVSYANEEQMQAAAFKSWSDLQSLYPAPWTSTMNELNHSFAMPHPAYANPPVYPPMGPPLPAQLHPQFAQQQQLQQQQQKQQPPLPHGAASSFIYQYQRHVLPTAPMHPSDSAAVAPAESSDYPFHQNNAMMPPPNTKRVINGGQPVHHQRSESTLGNATPDVGGKLEAGGEPDVDGPNYVGRLLRWVA